MSDFRSGICFYPVIFSLTGWKPIALLHLVRIGIVYPSDGLRTGEYYYDGNKLTSALGIPQAYELTIPETAIMYSFGTSNLITVLFLPFMAFLNQDGMCADESQSPRHISVDLNVGDGVTNNQSQIEQKYDKPGQYSETLKVVDVSGNVSYDFATVLVIDRKLVEQYSPTLHASYWPTFDLRPNDPITFKVRSFFCEPLGETWDFGDGSPLATVRSDGNAHRHATNGYAEVEHRYAKSGDYIVSVKHPGRDGHEMTARLHVRVQEPKPTEEPEVIELWPGTPPDEHDTIGAEYEPQALASGFFDRNVYEIATLG